MIRTYDDVLITTECETDALKRICQRSAGKWRWSRIRPSYGSEIIIRKATPARVSRVKDALASAGISIETIETGDFGGGAEADFFVAENGNKTWLTMQR